MTAILFVEPSSSGYGLLYACKKMGLTAVVLTANRDDRCIPDELLEMTDHLIVADTAADDEALEAVTRFHLHTPLSAVIPGFEYFVPLAAILAQALCLPGLSPETVFQVRYKHLMRDTVSAANLASPLYAAVTSIQESKSEALRIGFPLVVKPVGWSGSLFVKRADNFDQLECGLRAIFEEPFTEYGISPPRIALLESYLAGKEWSIEGYFFESVIHIISITEKFLGNEPHFIEIGHITPPCISKPERHEIERYVNSVVACLGITVGPFHCEIRSTPIGPVLIEIGARLAGDHICDLILNSTGINLYEITIGAFLGDKERVLSSARPTCQRVSGIRYFVRPDLTCYRSISGIEEVAEMPGLDSLKINIQAGQPMPQGTSSLGRLGYAIFTFDDYSLLCDALSAADRSINFIK